MKVVILAGGMGTRLGEETSLKPKPLVEVGEYPILWHIMKYYSSFGHREFIICLGYKGAMIKDFFMTYMSHYSDLTIDLLNNKIEYDYSKYEKENWKIHLVHTGDKNMTGSRIKQIEPYIGDDENFLLTYGDGVCNADFDAELAFHKKHGKIATMLAIQPPGRFGAINFNGDQITSFQEKPAGDGMYINGGFFICSKGIFSYLNDDPELIFEQAPLQNLANDGQLMGFKHNDFWQCMDTLRDKNYLEKLWHSGKAPWIR